MANFLLLNGPNLNLLGIREPELYGATTLAEIQDKFCQQAKASGHKADVFQSNAEHELINKIHAVKDNVDFIVFNPAAFTHTSIALRDALLAVEIPFIEVHLSDLTIRERFRHKSYFSDIAKSVIKGLGAKGYEIALDRAIHYSETNKTSKQRI